MAELVRELQARADALVDDLEGPEPYSVGTKLAELSILLRDVIMHLAEGESRAG